MQDWRLFSNYMKTIPQKRCEARSIKSTPARLLCVLGQDFLPEARINRDHLREPTAQIGCSAQAHDSSVAV